jgi:hypothetical protein
MKEILHEHEAAVRQAGQALIEVGVELASGRIEAALSRLLKAPQKYPEWDELDLATANIAAVMRDREGMLAVQQILAELAGTVIGSALRSGLR